MAANNLAQALAWIDEDEGPELNVGGSEPGGSSKHGVSMLVLQEYHRLHGMAPPTMDDMRALDTAKAGVIYTEKFAAPIRFDDLPPGVDYRLLDITINLGLTGGPTALQLALGMWPLTGKVDDKTLAWMTLFPMSPRELVYALGAAWIAKKHESPNWFPSAVTSKGYGHGWTNRHVKATARALSLIK